MALFQHLMNILKSPPPDRGPEDLKIAVAMLLIEAAHRDDTFSADERTVIARLLSGKFALSDQECAELLSACEEMSARTVQLHPYTRAVFERMDPAERIQLIEMLWEVAYADGVLDPEEDALIRRLGGLIYVTDRDRVLARHRVLERLKRASQ